MLPLWYTIFHEYSTKGYPVVRPLFWDFLADPLTHTDEDAAENEIMLGDVVLVRAVGKPMSEGDTAAVVLPQCAGWYDLHTGAFSSPGKYDLKLTMESIPAYYRAGTIVPLKNRIRRSSTCTWLDPFTLNIYLDPATGKAKGRVYIDDYKTKAYQEGTFLDVEFEFSAGVLKATSVSGKLPTNAAISTEVERVEIFGLKAPLKSTTLQAESATHKLEVPISRALGGEKGLYASVVKISHWFSLHDAWE